MEFELTYTPEQETFRKEVRSYLEEVIPPLKMKAAGPGDGAYQEWLKKREVGKALGRKGWLWPTMPVEYGGAGLTGDHALIIDEELQRFDLSGHPYYDTGATVGAPSIVVWG